MRKIMYISIIFFAIIIIFMAIIIKKHNKLKNINSELKKEVIVDYEEMELRKKYYKGGEGVLELLLPLAEKNGNWEHYPLTRHFKEKFNEKDGVLGKIEFDKVEFCPYKEGEYPFSTYPHYVITKGKEKIVYQLDWSIDNDEFGLRAIDDITLSKPIVFVDENGNELDTRLRCTEENWQTILNNFVSQEIETQHTIAVTDSFSELYPDFQDVFLKKVPSQKDFTSVIYSIETQEKSDYSKLTATYRCFEIKNTKNMRLYKVHFILDDKQYIDDVGIEVLE